MWVYELQTKSRWTRTGGRVRGEGGEKGMLASIARKRVSVISDV